MKFLKYILPRFLFLILLSALAFLVLFAATQLSIHAPRLMMAVILILLGGLVFSIGKAIRDDYRRSQDPDLFECRPPSFLDLWRDFHKAKKSDSQNRQ